MFKFNRLALAVVATSLTAGAFYTHAEEKITSSASVIVQNAIDFAEVSALNFGTITAKAVTTTTSATSDAITIFSDGTASKVTNNTAAATNATLNQVVDGAPAEFSISNASASTDITITLPASAELTSSVSTAKFNVSGFSAFDIGLGRGLTVTSNATTITTDDTGTASFRIGAKLAADVSTDAAFEDGTYSGTYEIKVSY